MADPRSCFSPVVLIPALNPDGRLVRLAQDVLAAGAPHIIVVDDGSAKACAPVFDELEGLPACTVLRHDENRGKGRALKTGMQYFLSDFRGSVGVITADCDGQHTAEDIMAVAERLSVCPDALILGVRDFSKENIPLRSRFGNFMTERLFKLLTGIAVTDTQTGLRGIPASRMEMFGALKGERFDYELSMLLACKQHSVAIEQVKISTIYINRNSGTHFNPFLDSIKVYIVLFKFISTSLISFLVDYGSFVFCTLLFTSWMWGDYASVFWAGVVSRVLSSTVNYMLNRRAVFKNNAKFSTVRYYVLAASLMLISSVAVTALDKLFGGGSQIFKILVDSLLFLGSFTIQREWVFSE